MNEFMEDFLEVYQDQKTGLWQIKDKDDKRAVLSLFTTEVGFATKEIAEKICKLLNQNAIV